MCIQLFHVGLQLAIVFIINYSADYLTDKSVNLSVYKY